MRNQGADQVSDVLGKRELVGKRQKPGPVLVGNQGLSSIGKSLTHVGDSETT